MKKYGQSIFSKDFLIVEKYNTLLFEHNLGSDFNLNVKVL